MNSSFYKFENKRHNNLISGLEWGKFRTNLFDVPVFRVIREAKHDYLSGLILAANSHRARLRWHRSFLHNVVEMIGDSCDEAGRSGQLHFASLIDMRQAYQRPRDVPAVGHLAFHYTYPLQGLNFVGMLEPALYVSLRRPQSPSPTLFMWHAHLLVWDGCQDAFDQAREVAGRRGFRTFLPGAPALLTKPFPHCDLERVVGYINKSPRHQYSVANRGAGTRLKQYRRGATGGQSRPPTSAS